MILFTGCEVFAPERSGRRDVLVAGGRIVAIAPEVSVPLGIEVLTLECDGLRMVPGLIDGHVHIAGAGGEGGPASRTPEMQLGQMLDGGITTVIGCLGTDGLTRSIESILMKAKALRAEGVSCWILTGSYQVPPPTLLGDVGRDIALIDEIIGAGEIAVADHRSSFPSVEELIRLVEHARVGGMLGGKAGVVVFHMGDAPDPFRILRQLVERSELGYRQLLPTHVNRNRHILDDAKSYALEGPVDVTASSWEYFPEDEIKASRAVVELLDAGVPLEHVTMSSDACGSLPAFDKDGKLIRLESGKPRSIFEELLALVRDEGLALEDALRPVTSNVAAALRLPRKGRIEVGYDGDLLVLDSEYGIRHMTANGELLVQDGIRLKKGAFEG